MPIHNDKGFNIVEMQIVIVIIIIIILIAIPQFDSFRRGDFAEEVEAIESIGEVLVEGGGAAYEKAKDDLPEVCPVVERPYDVTYEQGRFSVCCPDPDNHLGIGEVKSCFTESGWHRDIVADGGAQSAPVTEGRARGVLFTDWEVASSNNTLVIEAKDNWKWYVALLAALIATFLVSFNLLEGPLEKLNRKSTLYEVLTAIFSFALVISLIFGLATALYGVGLLATTERVEVSDGSVKITKKSFFIERINVELSASDVRAVGLYRWKGGRNVFIIWRSFDEGGDKDEAEEGSYFMDLRDDAVASSVAAAVRGLVFKVTPGGGEMGGVDGSGEDGDDGPAEDRDEEEGGIEGEAGG